MGLGSTTPANKAVTQSIPPSRWAKIWELLSFRNVSCLFSRRARIQKSNLPSLPLPLTDDVTFEKMSNQKNVPLFPPYSDFARPLPIQKLGLKKISIMLEKMTLMKKHEVSVKKYEGKMKELWRNMKEFWRNMKEFWRNMWEIWRNLWKTLRLGKNSEFQPSYRLWDLEKRSNERSEVRDVLYSSLPTFKPWDLE